MVFCYAAAFLRRSPILRKMIANVTAFEIQLTNNVTIAVHSNSFRLIRGRTLLACIFDEIAFWRDDSSANPDIETYRAVRPTLGPHRWHVDRHLLALSPGRSASPKVQGPLRRRRSRRAGGQGRNGGVQPDDLARTSSTRRWPRIPRLAALNGWPSSGATSPRCSMIRSLTMPSTHGRPLELPPRGGRKYFAFTDASAGRHDAFTFCVGHVEGNKDEAGFVCDVIRGRPAPFDPRSVAQRICSARS